VVAALAALNFFATANTGDPQSYVIGSAPGQVNSDRLNLRALPSYQVGATEIDAEKVFLTTAVLIHLLRHQVPWDKRAKEWGKEIEGLRRLYEKNEAKKEEDRGFYESAANLMTSFLLSTLDPRVAIGWSGEDAARLWTFLSNEPEHVNEVTGRLAKKFMSNEPKGSLELGDSMVKLTTFDFGKWCPAGEQFTRGEFLRFAWSNLYARCHNRI
jgi:hypothetical protein